jgi:uncharacterized coiled-coil protein SlyX
MSKRYSHTTKTPKDRSTYQRYLPNIDVQPTVDETEDFNESTSSGEELTQPTIKRQRKIPLKDQIRNHFSSHWIEWSVGIVLLLLGFLMYDSKISIAILENNLSNQEKQIENLAASFDKSLTNQQSQIEKIDDKVDRIIDMKHDQQLLLQELQLRLEFIENP